MSDYSFDDFMGIIRKLRSEEGCPWDREQTHESLRTCMLEECYEAIEAINNVVPQIRSSCSMQFILS